MPSADAKRATTADRCSTAPDRALCAASIAGDFSSERTAVEPIEMLPLPDDPVLASWARAMNEAGHWAYVLDAHWRLVFVTNESVRSEGDVGATTWPIGHHWYSTEVVEHLAVIAG